MRSVTITKGLTQTIRSWEVQKAPYFLPLPYRSMTRRETHYPFHPSNGIVNDVFYSVASLSMYNRAKDDVASTARSKAISHAKSNTGAQLGLTIISWRQSLDMVSGALKSLASKRARARLYYKKKASDIYLEGIFGWVPLMQDIYSAFEVLSSPIACDKVSGKGKTTISNAILDSTNRGVVQTNFSAKASLTLRLRNPNVALLGNLGLLNPAAVMWDMVPYSFVINWFVPVGAYLSSLSDLYGYEVENPFCTTHFVANASGDVLVRNDVGKYVWMPRVFTRVETERKLGLPPLKLPPPRMPTANLTKAMISLALFDKQRDPTPKRRHF